VAVPNTVEAFLLAVEMGAAGIELDVRRTAEEALVVHHDARLADGRAIVDCLAGDLPAMIPTLRQALDACAGAFVNIEIKNDPSEPDFDDAERVAGAVMAELAARAGPATAWLISSFRMATVDRCRSIDPATPTAWLTDAAVGPAEVADVADRGHAAVHPFDPTVDDAVIAACHARGVRVNTWTCNDPARARTLASWGIDGICTDVPDVILAALRPN